MQPREKLSLLWIFLFLNFIFCDVFSLMYPPMIQEMAAGNLVDGLELSQGMLLGFAMVMELGMAMVVAARLLPRAVGRPLNIGLGFGFIALQLWSLTGSGATLHYWFFSAVEVATLLWIVAGAWSWKSEQTA
jgi:hypothetical protein